MRREKISDALGYMDERFVEEAGDFLGKEVGTKSKKRSWFIAGAGVCVALMAGILLLPRILEKETNQVNIGGINRIYKNKVITTMELARIWPWEYQTVTEQFGTLIMDDKGYRIRGTGISESYLGEELGGFQAKGYDHYTEKEYTREFQVREIRGIASDKMVAVNMEGAYYVFAADEYAPPATLGELLESYNLENTLPLQGFEHYEGHDSKGYFQVEADEEIWKILTECKEAEFLEDDTWNRSEREYLSFTATSERLGVYKRVAYITADGYFATNVFDYSYKYYIGEEAAGRIMEYALEHCVEAKMEQYTNVLVGTIMEIKDDFVIIDDGILCKNTEDGMQFRISMKDMKVKRFVEVEKAKVGDTVSVQFRGNIDVNSGNLIKQLYDITEARIQDDEVWVEE